MIRFDIITIFPELFDCFLRESLIGKGQKRKLIKIKVHNLRDFTRDKHKTVDDKAYGGGRGMVIMIEPVYRAVQKIKKKNKKSKVILFTPRGRKFNQRMAQEFANQDQLIFICGRYEGVDERIAQAVADINLSIGNYILMGGELPAMVVIEAVARLAPGLIGKSEDMKKERILEDGGFFEYPQYTRPEIFITSNGKKLRVPKVLLSGNHKKIEEWRKKKGRIIK